MAAMCCFSPKGDLQTFGHLSQGNPPELGDMMGEGDKRHAGDHGASRVRIDLPAADPFHRYSQPQMVRFFLNPPMLRVFLRPSHSGQVLEVVIGCYGPCMQPSRNFEIFGLVIALTDIRKWVPFLISPSSAHLSLFYSPSISNQLEKPHAHSPQPWLPRRGLVTRTYTLVPLS